MEDEESVDPEEQPQTSPEGEVEMPEEEALEEEEDPMVSIEVEVVRNVVNVELELLLISNCNWRSVPD